MTTVSSEVQPGRILDAQGLDCPLPILETRKAIADLASGEVLQVIATDPGSVNDMASFCRQTGNQLVASGETAGTDRFLIRKA